MRLGCALTLLLPVLAGCQRQEAPNVFYERYYQQSAAGIASLEEEARFHSARKHAEVERRIPAMMALMNKSREEVARIELDMSGTLARCKQIELAEQSVSGNVAELTYRQKDVCGGASTAPQTQKVHLVNEDGWKIDRVEVRL